MVTLADRTAREDEGHGPFTHMAHDNQTGQNILDPSLSAASPQSSLPTLLFVTQCPKPPKQIHGKIPRKQELVPPNRGPR
eukprot:5681049-Ditylum_brightwellii.AAC.1